MHGFNVDTLRAPSDAVNIKNTPGGTGPGIVESVGRGIKDIVTNPGQTAKSIGRGVINAGREVANTGIEVGAWLLHHDAKNNKGLLASLFVDDDWMKTYDALGARGIAEAGTDFIGRANDWIFGERSESGGQQFVEDTSTFVTAFIGTAELKLFRGGTALAAWGEAAVPFRGTLGMVVKGTQRAAGAAIRGAVVDMTAFDPYQAQLAELAARSHMAGVSELGQLLSVKGDDNPLTARFKRAVGGVIPGVAIDALVASARFFRNLEIVRDTKATPAAREAAQRAVAENGNILANVADGTHVPNDPIVVKPTATGRWTVEVNGPEAERMFAEMQGSGFAQKPAASVEIPRGQVAGNGSTQSMVTKARQLLGDEEFIRQVRAEQQKRGVTSASDPLAAGAAAEEVARRTVSPEGRLLTPAEVAQRNARSAGGVSRTGAVDNLDMPTFQRRKAERRVSDAPVKTDRRIAARRSALEGPEFDARWQAEAQAASANEALAVRLQANTALSKQQMADIFNLARQIEEAQGDPDKIVQLFQEARFNFSYMDSPKKVESILQSISEHMSSVFDKTQGRPVVPITESIDRAVQLAGMLTREDAPEYLANAGNVLKNADANLLVMNSRMSELGEHVAKWSTILDERPTDFVANMEARRALRSYINFAADVAGSNSGVGRGLNALKARGAEELRNLKFKGEAGAATAKTAGELSPDVVAGMTAAELRDVSRLFRMSKEPRVLFNTLASEIKPANMGKIARFGSGMLEYFYNSVLSSPATWTAIFTANATVSMVEDGVRMLAGVIRRDPEMIREAADLVTGRLIYLRQSVKGMWSAAKAGHSIIDPRPTYKRIPGVAGEVVRTFGTRPISAMDEFWRVNNNLAFVRMNSLKIARREAAAKGLAGEAMDNFLAKRVESDVAASIDPATGASRLPAAREFAAFPTFNTPLKEGSFGSWLEEGVQKFPMLTPIMPFVRTSINVLDYSFLKSSPLGLFSSNVRKAIMSGSPEGAVMASRMVVGTTVWGTAGLLAFSGSLAGNGPSDPALRRAWMTTHQPYSIKIGDKWVSYRRLEPFATALSTAADVAQIMRDNADDMQVQQDGSKVVYGLIAATVSAGTNKTWMSGLINFFDAIGERSPAKVKSWVDGMMSVGIPNILQTVNQDPYMRETSRMFDALVNRVPGWSQSLPAKYNVFGEPVTMRPSRTQRTLNPFPVKDGTPMLEDEILQLHRAFAPEPTIQKFGDLTVNLHDRAYRNKNGGNLTPYERMMEIVHDQNLRGQLEEITSSAAYQRAGDGTEVFAGGRRFRELQDRIERVYTHARRKMLVEYPDLARDLKGLDRARRASQRSDAKGEGILDRINR